MILHKWITNQIYKAWIQQSNSLQTISTIGVVFSSINKDKKKKAW